jgi:hypothetical protein
VKRCRSRAHDFWPTSRHEPSGSERRASTIDDIVATEFTQAAVSTLTAAEVIAGCHRRDVNWAADCVLTVRRRNGHLALSSLSSTPQALGPAWPVRYPPTGRVFTFSGRPASAGCVEQPSQAILAGGATLSCRKNDPTQCPVAPNSRAIVANLFAVFSNGSCTGAHKSQPDTQSLSVALAGVRRVITRAADNICGLRYFSDVAATVAAAPLRRCPTFVRFLRAD